MTIGEKIRKRRNELHLTLEEVGKFANTTRNTIYKYEKGIITNIPSDKIEKISTILQVNPGYLMGRNEVKEEKQGVKVPVLGRVAAGIPISAVQEIIDYEEITEELARTGEFFALQIKGDSMMPRFVEGDVVIVKRQPDVESGDIAVVMVNGEDATIKKVKKVDGGIMLIANNPLYEPTFYSNHMITTLPVSIIGKVVELRGKF